MPIKFKLQGSGLFIETGSYRGDGIQAALDANFRKVISIEINERWYNYCKNRFAPEIEEDRVELILGDTSEHLPMIAQELDQPATFWLDAHTQTFNTKDGDNIVKNCPIFEELDAISLSKCQSHNILIDDVRLLSNAQAWGGHDVSVEKVIQRAREINPKYICSFRTGFRRKDVLFLSVDEKKADDFAYLAVIASSDEAREAAVKAAVELGQEDPELLLIEARKSLQSNQYDLAVAKSKRAIELEPSDAEILDSASKILKRCGAVEDAINGFRKLIEIDGKTPGYFLFLAELLLQKRNFNEALIMAERAKELSNNCSDRLLQCIEKAKSGSIHSSK